MQIDIHGLAENRKELTGMIERIKQPEKVLKLIAQDAVTFSRDSFRSETDPEGKPWKDLQPATWKRKLEKGYTKKLVNKSILQNSVNVVTKGGSVALSMIAYGLPHQFGPKGGERADGGQKKRAFLPFEKVGEKLEVVSTGRGAKFVERITRRIVNYFLGKSARQQEARGSNRQGE